MIINAKNFTYEREKRGWTQAHTAKLLGVSRQTVNAYEKGSIIPKAKHCLIRQIFDNESTPDFVSQERLSYGTDKKVVEILIGRIAELEKENKELKNQLNISK